VYRKLAEVGAEDLAIMALIDRHYLARPYYGSRRMAAWLATQGHRVNRKRVQRLMGDVTLDIPGKCNIAPRPEANIGNALAGREIARHLRELGANTRGPAPLTKRDRSRFLSVLDTALQAALREAARS
jgi:hypothetical protein